MPPKAKFTKEEIIQAAISIVERVGADALTARSLASALGSSARPIFTVFTGMNEVNDAVCAYAKAVYAEYVNDGLREDKAFRGVGKAYIRFAAARPRLFQLLFMRERGDLPDQNSILVGIEEHYKEILQSITREYSVDDNTAARLYFHIWVYSHGLAVLLATRVCAISEEEIESNLTRVFRALYLRHKNGETL